MPLRFLSSRPQDSFGAEKIALPLDEQRNSLIGSVSVPYSEPAIEASRFGRYLSEHIGKAILPIAMSALHACGSGDHEPRLQRWRDCTEQAQRAIKERSVLPIVTCAQCGDTRTSLLRVGPSGERTLCNKYDCSCNGSRNLTLNLAGAVYYTRSWSGVCKTPRGAESVFLSRALCTTATRSQRLRHKGGRSYDHQASPKLACRFFQCSSSTTRQRRTLAATRHEPPSLT